MKWTERGLRKYGAFLISLLAYCVIFSVTVFGGFIESANIPILAFQLGLGIASVTGVFFASNVLSKKVSGYGQGISDYDGGYPTVGSGSVGMDGRQETQSQRNMGL